MKQIKTFPFLLFLFLVAPSFLFGGGYFTFTSNETVESPGVSVEIDGQPVEVVDFFQVDAKADNSAFLSHPAGRRQLVFLYDLIFSSKDEIVAARKTTLEFLQKAGKDDLITVAGISINGLKIYCASTADRNQVIAGLNSIGKDKVESMMPGADGNFYPATASPDAARVEPLSDDAFAQNLKPFGLGEKRKQDHAFIMVQTLVDFAHDLCSLHGRKTMLFFSPGFETKEISLNLDLEQRRADSKNAPSTADSSEPASLDTITNSFRNVEELAEKGPARRPRQLGVEIIPDLYEGTDTHIFTVNSSAEENGFLKSLSEKTGAKYYQQAVAVDEVLSAEQKFYVVEWQDIKRKDWKALSSVKISAASHKISAPAKWFVPRRPAEQSAEERRLHIAEAVYKDFQKPPAECRFWTDLVFDQGNSKIPTFVQVPGSELLKYGQSNLKLEFYGFVIGMDGAALDSSVVPVEMDLSNKALRDRVSTSGLKVWNLLIGQVKPLTVRTVIINPGTGDTFTNTTFLDVKDSGLTMSNPFVPATNFNWVIWPKPQDEMTRRGVALQYPYRMGKDFFFPDLAPVMKTTAKSGVIYFRLYNVLPESKNPSVKFHLTDAKGQSVEIQDFHLMQKPTDVEHSGMELFWNLNTLPAVQPGSYRIKIGILDPVRKQVVVREVQNLKIPSS